VNLPIQEIFIHHDFRTRPSANSRTSQISDFVVSQVHDSGSSQVRDSELRRSRASDLRKFATPSFAGPGLRIFASSRYLKTHFTNFVKLDVSRVIGFPELPNTWRMVYEAAANSPREQGGQSATLGRTVCQTQ
jgi:hypothetical protein